MGRDDEQREQDLVPQVRDLESVAERTEHDFSSYRTSTAPPAAAIFALAASLNACAFTVSGTVTSPLPSIFTRPRLLRTSPRSRSPAGSTVEPAPKAFR